MNESPLAPLWRVGVALAVGLFIGAERERRKGQGPGRGAAGIRTFGLVAVLGGLAALVGTWLIIVGGLFVAAATVAAYLRSNREDPGLTTEVALMVTYGLGVMAIERPGVALAIGATVAALLALRERIHTLVKERISEQELVDAIVFAVAAVVVLPLLPNRAIDPFGAINPYTLWRLVVVMMALTAGGHILQRLFGGKLGLTFSGLAGGFVSSSATIMSMGERAQSEPLLQSAVAGATASTVSTFVQMALLVLAASPALFARAVWFLVAGGLTALAYAGLQAWRATKTPPPPLPDGSALSVRTAVFFAALVGVLTFLSALAQRYFGATGLLVSMAIAGFADAHATASSVASIYAAGQVTEQSACLGILLALSTNTLTKIVMAGSTGPRPFLRRVRTGLFLTIVASWTSAALLLLRR